MNSPDLFLHSLEIVHHAPYLSFVCDERAAWSLQLHKSFLTARYEVFFIRSAFFPCAFQLLGGQNILGFSWALLKKGDQEQDAQHKEKRKKLILMNFWFSHRRIFLEFVEVRELPFEFLVLFYDPLALFTEVRITYLELVNLHFLFVPWYLRRHSVSFLFSFLLNFLYFIFNDLRVSEDIDILFQVYIFVTFFRKVSLKEHFSLQYFFSPFGLW